MSDYPFNFSGYHFKITTKSAISQQFFDFGIAWCYGFNHDEAIHCFKRCREADEHCAMAYWGIAYACGTNYNDYDGLDSKRCSMAWENIRKAHQLKEKVSPVEKALIEALLCRYNETIPNDMLQHYQIQFSNSMREVYSQFPNHLDVVCVFAESLMMLSPWKLWENGKPAPHTPEIVTVLTKAVEEGEPHFGIYHLYIHLMELSPNLSSALKIAWSLSSFKMDLGHLIHMPSHIFIQLGMYEESIKANLLAIEADERYLKYRKEVAFYLLYMMHNHHFIIYAGMMDGRFNMAWEYANKLLALITPSLFLDYADFMESFVSMPLHVLVRFGKWKEILQYPLPPTSPSVPVPTTLSPYSLPAPPQPNFYAYTTALVHYARSVALSSLSRPQEAENEKILMEEAISQISPSRKLFTNKCIDIIQVARKMAEGEINFRTGKLNLKPTQIENLEAINSGLLSLRKGVELEEGLVYEEPWAWMQPVRHALGALLLEVGRVEEAEVVYRDDLRRNPENCWGLVGLEECLRRKGESKELLEIEEKGKKARERNDIEIKGSCFCRVFENDKI